MDADNRIIPLVDDDQGEGVKDPLDLDDVMDLYSETLQEHRGELFKHLEKQDPKKHRTATEVKWAPPKRFDRNR